MILSIEKRLNFTIDELDVTAHSYDYFRSYLTVGDDANTTSTETDTTSTTTTTTTTTNTTDTTATTTTNTTNTTNTMNAMDTTNTSTTTGTSLQREELRQQHKDVPAIFRARPIPVDFPQYFEYERVKELELWEITLG